MSKLKRLETKKLLRELEFIESDYDYKNEVISEADGDFLNSVNAFLTSHPELKEMFDKKINDKIDQMIKKKEEDVKEIERKEMESEMGGGSNDEESINEDDNIEEGEQDTKDIEDVRSPKLKKIYREIVKLTHPDKVKNSKLNDLYIKGTGFYDKNDIAGLYSICNELNIEYEVDDEDNVLISTKISTLKQRIGFMESTYTWKLHFSKDDSEKNNIILTYIRMQLA